MGIVRAAFFLVGMTVGAGFLTGAELVRFFGEGSVFAFALSCLVSFAANAFFLRLGRRHGGFGGTMAALFGRGGDAVGCVLLAVAFVPCAGMLAALDALFPSLGAAASLLGLAVVLVFVRHGTRGVSLLNVLLVPLLLAFVFLLGKAPLRAASAGWGNAFLYAFMNAAFSAPALMDAGREVRAPVRAALLAAGCIFLCGALILGAIARAGNPGSPMPFLVVAGGNRLFFLAAACAVLTSLAAALFPLLSACERYAGKAKNAAKGIVLVAAFLLSRLGFSGVIDRLYPAVGVFGILFSVLCVFDEYFFKKYHKGVHTRGKQAQKEGGAHHEVELEHLPAVDDEIAESRARDDVFAHDGADPRHADADFEHGDQRRIGGRQNEF